MPWLDRPSIQVAPRARPTTAARGWRFRLVQITVIVIACFYADAAMTGGVVRRGLAQDAKNVWQTARHTHLFKPFLP
jgi:hypothetical protein